MAEPTKIDLLLEAERRGILPADKVELLAEARRRGLVAKNDTLARGEARIEQEIPAAQARLAKPVEETLPPIVPQGGFRAIERAPSRALSVMGEEFSGGLQQLLRGFTDPFAKEPREQSMLGPLNIPLGLLRMGPGAISRGAGQYVGEVAQDITRPILGETAAAVAGTAASIPTEIAMGGRLIAGGANTLAALRRQLGQTLSRTRDVAFARRQAAVEQAPKLIEGVKPPIPSQSLYAEVKEINPEVPLQPLRPILKQLLDEESLAKGTGLEHPRTTSMLSKLNKKFFEKKTTEETLPILNEYGKAITRTIETGGTGVAPFRQAQLLMQRINERIGTLKQRGGEELGDALQVKKGFIRSLEQATEDKVGEAYAKLRQANKAFKREIAYDEMSNIIAKNIKSLEARPEAGAQNIAAGRSLDQIRKFLKDDADIAKEIPKEVINRIESGLDRIRQLPAFGAPPGIDAGSKNMLMKLLLAGTLGGPLGSAAGVGAGVGTVGAYYGGEALVKVLARPGGIKFIERLINSPGGYTPAKAAAFAAFARGTGQLGEE